MLGDHVFSSWGRWLHTPLKKVCVGTIGNVGDFVESPPQKKKKKKKFRCFSRKNLTLHTSSHSNSIPDRGQYNKTYARVQYCYRPVRRGTNEELEGENDSDDGLCMMRKREKIKKSSSLTPWLYSTLPYLSALSLYALSLFMPCRYIGQPFSGLVRRHLGG